MSKNKEGGKEEPIPNEIQDLLQQFERVFAVLSGLPPFRGHDHAIVLKEGVSPISVRPYRYPQVQKDEIEHLVQEMLQSGII